MEFTPFELLEIVMAEYSRIGRKHLLGILPDGIRYQTSAMTFPDFGNCRENILIPVNLYREMWRFPERQTNPANLSTNPDNPDRSRSIPGSIPEILWLIPVKIPTNIIR